MIIDTARVAGSVTDLTATLSGDPDHGIVLPTITARVVRDLQNRVEFSQNGGDYVFDSDEGEFLGGNSLAPSPMRYFLSGIAFCEAVWYAKCASLLGLGIDALSITLSAYLDTHGEHRVGDQVPSHPQWLAMRVEVESSAGAAELLAAIDDGDERCPLGVLVRRAVPVHQSVVLNGETIRDTPPEEVRRAFETLPAR